MNFFVIFYKLLKLKINFNMLNTLIKKPEVYANIKNSLLGEVGKKSFPGGVVGITTFKGKGRETVIIPFGYLDYESKIKVNDKTYYDLASLTKPLSTLLSILVLKKQKKICFDSNLKDVIEQKIPENKNNINIYSLLNHSSGLPAYREFYKKLQSYHNYEEVISHIFKEDIEYEMFTKQVYSDLGYIVLGYIIEKKANMPIEEFTYKKIYKPLGIEKNIFFNRDNSPKKDLIYAPTERCLWRKKTLCGQVHDDNAFALGGVCGHAGLFANIFGVVDLVSVLMDILKNRRVFDPIDREDLVQAIKRQSNIGSWGLGFDTPSTQGSSSGSLFSKRSFGHLGFTGTSFWADLEKDISIILLTNRVHPDRDNNKIKKYRPIFHDLVMKYVENI